MQLGMIGLGRMGGNIVRRLMRDGHQLRRLRPERRRGAGARRRRREPAAATSPISSGSSSKPRAVWVMLPAGQITETRSSSCAACWKPATSSSTAATRFYQDDIRARRDAEAEGHPLCRCRHQRRRLGPRARLLHDDRRRQGRVDHLDPIFKTLAPGKGTSTGRPAARSRDRTAEDGYLHCGPAGAGHFVKMVHNGIEYGVMQAYAEGFDILRNVSSAGGAGKPALQPRPPRHRRSVAPRQRDRLVAARSDRDRAGRGPELAKLPARSQIPARALDDPGGDRGGGAGRGVVVGALHPLPLAPGAHLRREDPVGDAP